MSFSFEFFFSGALSNRFELDVAVVFPNVRCWLVQYCLVGNAIRSGSSIERTTEADLITYVAEATHGAMALQLHCVCPHIASGPSEQNTMKHIFCSTRETWT